MTRDEMKKLTPGQIIVSEKWSDPNVDTIKKVNERKVTIVADDPRFISFSDIIIAFPADQGAQAYKFAEGLRSLNRDRSKREHEVQSWYIAERKKWLEQFGAAQCK